MTTLQIIAHCRDNGIELSTAGGKLYAGPRERITAETARTLRANKEVVILFLSTGDVAALVPPEARGPKYRTWQLAQQRKEFEELLRATRAKEEAEQ